MNNSLDNIRVKIILGIDSLLSPLTGIGRYTYELGTRLAQAPVIERLRLLSLAGWHNPTETFAALRDQATGPVGTTWAPARLAGLRRRLASYRTAGWCYRHIAGGLTARRLQPLAGDHLYHSPDFSCPDFDGPRLVTVHDLSVLLRPDDHPRARVDYVGAELRKIVDSDAHLITVSDRVRQEVIQALGVSPSRVTAILNGVDPAFRPRSVAELVFPLGRHGLVPGGYLLSVATLEPRKNLMRLVEAYLRLAPSMRQQWPLVLVGSAGWKTDDLKARLRTGQAEGSLHYLGYVPQSELPLLYAGARGLAYLSLYEGFGLPVLEAMASGTPVLTSADSAMAEVALSAAKLVNPLDVEAISVALGELLEDGPMRDLLSSRGLERAANLSWDHCARHTLGLYQQLLQR